MNSGVKKDSVEIEVYADESYPDKSKNFNFLVISCLFLPYNQKQDLIKRLVNKRCLNETNKRWSKEFNLCPNNLKCKLERHLNNNVEIHSLEIKSSSSFSTKKISRLWAEQFVNEKNIFFASLYVNLENLDITRFGESELQNIYNKFFRTIISYGVKSFFSNCEKIIVKKVYHDNTDSLEYHPYFKYLNLIKLSQEFTNKNLSFQNNQIFFIESDHKKSKCYEESHILQYIDLINGLIKQNIFYTSKDSTKVKIASIIRKPLNLWLEKKTGVDNLRISFFPDRKIDITLIKDLNGDLHETFKSNFYTPKTLMMPLPGTKKLTDFF